VFNVRRFFFLPKKSRRSFIKEIRRSRRDAQNAVQKKRPLEKMLRLVLRSSVIIAESMTRCRSSQKPDGQCYAKNVTIPVVPEAGTPNHKVQGFAFKVQSLESFEP